MNVRTKITFLKLVLWLTVVVCFVGGFMDAREHRWGWAVFDACVLIYCFKKAVEVSCNLRG